MLQINPPEDLIINAVIDRATGYWGTSWEFIFCLGTVPLLLCFFREAMWTRKGACNEMYFLYLFILAFIKYFWSDLIKEN